MPQVLDLLADAAEGERPAAQVVPDDGEETVLDGVEAGELLLFGADVGEVGQEKGIAEELLLVAEGGRLKRESALLAPPVEEFDDTLGTLVLEHPTEVFFQ